MAFTIVLQRNDSESNRLTKTLTDILSLSGTLKTETSIIDPVILVEADLSTLTGCNYCTIQAFGRSYFVTNIRSIRNGLVEISCHVDVLSTYATQIRANRAIVQRQENEWNLYLNDGVFKTYQNPQTVTKVFPAGFGTKHYFLTVAG